MCMPTLPKIFRTATKNTLIFLLGLITTRNVTYSHMQSKIWHIFANKGQLLLHP